MVKKIVCLHNCIKKLKHNFSAKKIYEKLANMVKML